jgi:hypothetical protein
MTEGKKHSPIPGLILIFLAAVLLLSNFEIIDIRAEMIWIYILIFLGIVFWAGFFIDRSQPGRLMPGCILLTYGIIFAVSANSDWELMEHLWPFFILGPAFGFYAMFIFGKHDKGLLIPAGILTIIGVFFLLQSFDYQLQLVFGVTILLVGILLLFRSLRGGKTGEE